MDYSSRQAALRDQLVKSRVGVLLVTHLPNVRYLCGFTGSAGVLAVHAGKPVFFTDGRYREQAHAEVQGAQIVVAKTGALTAAADWASKRGMRVIGLEANHTTLATRSALKRTLGAGFKLREVGGLIERQRQRKDEAEIARVRDAVNLGASLLDVALSAIRPGVKETDVAAELEYEARQRGADAMSFETIVAAGARSALPHGRASASAIPARGFVVLDFGVILHGYCSDMTRTVWVGKISRSERDLYEAVREAQQAGIEAVRAGATCGEVDHAARSVLRKARLDRYFTHSTGHGVGLEIHEEPRIARGRREVLEPGMVITIEPGVYIAGRGGVRIEDMVVVREGGCEILTPAPKALIQL
jgi:Xaa-Pro aminopeptidase